MVRNPLSLLSTERRERLIAHEMDDCLNASQEFTIDIDHDFAQTDMVRIARKHRLTAYDAACLELALRRGIPIASLDRALIAAAKAESVMVIGA